MKNIRAMLILVFSVSAIAHAQPKTVTEFYLALPSSVHEIAGMQDGSGFEDDPLFYFKRSESKSAIANYRKSLIKIADIKNGYLRLEDNGWEGWAEVALFKKVDGTYLVAISSVGCGPGCSGDFVLLAYENGNWSNVTNRVFPAVDAYEGNYFKLPRVGTIVELHRGEDCGTDFDCRSREKLVEFNWDKTRFIRVAGPSDEDFWLGKFEHEDGGGKEIDRLEVVRKNGKLTAVFRAIITAQLSKFFSLDVEVKGNTAYFYYDRCLPKAGEEHYDPDYDPNPCDKDTNMKGDLMFRLEKSFDRNKKPIILTYAGKLRDLDAAVFKKVK